MFTTGKQILPIGVDVGFDSIKLLQLHVVDGKLAVAAAARASMVAGEAQAQPGSRSEFAAKTIQKLLRSGNFSGRRIVTALPREIVVVKNLRLPQMPDSELAAAVEFEARNIFPFDTEQAQIRFLHAGQVRQGSDHREEVLVLAAKHTEVDDYVELLHQHGLQIDSLDFEPAAIYRSVERFIRRKDDESEVNVLVDIGARRSQVIIGRGREISFYKPIDVGGLQLHEVVARKLQVTVDEARALRRRLIDAAQSTETSGERSNRDPVRQAVFDATRSLAQDLAREVSLCLRYFSVTFRGQRPTRVRLSGGEACDPQLLAVLSANLPVPVETARPLHSIDTSRMKPADRRGFLCEWTAALGLSLKQVPEHFGARDGQRREVVADIATRATGEAVVVDLARELKTVEQAETVSPLVAATRRSAREVASA